MVYIILVQRKNENIFYFSNDLNYFRTIFNVNLNDAHSYPNDKYELLVGTLNPKWERINA